MNFAELKKQNKSAYAIATVNVETGIDGGWQISLQSIDTVENYIKQIKELKKANTELWCGILRDGEYLSFNDLMLRLDFQIITKAEADILNKYNAFSENHLSLDEF